MKKGITLTALAGILVLSSCKSGAENKADSAWKTAKTESNEGKKLMKQKEAYIYYQQALQKKGEKSKPQLMSNFILAAVARIEYIYETEGSQAQAIKFIRDEIEKFVEKEGVRADAKDAYATLVMKLADEARTNGKLTDCMALVETALRVAADKASITSTKNEITKDYITEQLTTAKIQLETGKKLKDVNELIRADYFTNVAINYDSTNADAKTLLSSVRQALLGAYTAYEAAIEFKSDTALYNRIDTNKILMAVTTANGANLELMVYNNGFNAIRLKPSNFTLVDETGATYPASTVKAEKDFLEMEFETKASVSFPKPAGKIKAIVYSNEDKDLRGTKYFY